MARDAIAAQGGQSYGVIPRVAGQLGVGPESLRGWLRRDEIDSGERPGTSSADALSIPRFDGHLH